MDGLRYKVLLLTDALEELDEIVAYYELQQSGLGRRFLDAYWPHWLRQTCFGYDDRAIIFLVPFHMNRYHKKYLYDLDRVLERLFIMLDQREAAETDFQRDDTLRAAATHLTDRTVFFAKRMWERWQVAVPYLPPLLVEDRIRQDDYRTEVSWPFIQGVLRPLHHEVKRLLAAPTDPHPAPRLRHTLRPLIQRNLAQIRQLAASHGLEKLCCLVPCCAMIFARILTLTFFFSGPKHSAPTIPLVYVAT